MAFMNKARMRKMMKMRPSRNVGAPAYAEDRESKAENTYADYDPDDYMNPYHDYDDREMADMQKKKKKMMMDYDDYDYDEGNPGHSY